MSPAGVEPIQDVAHLAHVEIRSPRMSETIEFLTAIIGLQESHRDGSSVYLRACGDYYHHTLKVTDAAQPGLGHAAWRAVSPQALERRAAVLHERGSGRTPHGNLL
jgi:catechol 2,3-dioxygenase